MSSRVGIAVRGDALCMVQRRGAVRIDLLSAERPPEVAWGRFLEQALEHIPARARGRTSVLVALDAPRVRRKRLFGVPAATTESDVRSVLEREVHSFFVASSGPLVAGDPVRVEDEWWAAAAAASEVEEIARASAACGVRLAGIVPLDDASAAADLADAAWSLARADDAPPFVIDPLRPSRAAHARRLGGFMFLSTLLFLLSFAALAPTAVLKWETHRLRREAAAELQLLRADGEVHGAALRALAIERAAVGLRDESTPAAGILSRITLALPEGAVIVHASFEGATVSLTLLAPVNVDLVGALGRVPGLSTPVLVGALARESLAGAEVQRTRLVFGTAGAAADPAAARVVRR